MSDEPDPRRSLKEFLLSIPQGMVVTYGDLAQALGAKSAARWVAQEQASPLERELPWHRVVRQTGEFPEKFRDLLVAEEIAGAKQGRCDLEQHRFRLRVEPNPVLEKLASDQASLIQQFVEDDAPFPSGLIAGLDLSYRTPTEGVVCFALVEFPSLKFAGSTTLRVQVDFPYIPGFLSYRELKPMRSVIDQANREGKRADLIVVDGNGRLHPRLAGIATHLGIHCGIRTIGVAKSLLTGRSVRGIITLNEEPVAVPVSPKPSVKPLFVSPGHRMTLNRASEIVQKLFDGTHRLPVPLYYADHLSRLEARMPLPEA